MNTYECFSRQYTGQDNRNVFAYMGYNVAKGENWQTPYLKLADMAEEECWDFLDDSLRRPGIEIPILKNYIDRTFLRVLEEEKINIISNDTSEKLCWNTGLQTRYGGIDIYALCIRNPNASELNQTDWIFQGFYDKSSYYLQDFASLPERASYINNASEFQIDPTYAIEVQFDHIIHDNKDRLPEILKDNCVLSRNAFLGAVSLLQKKIKQNLNIAAPNWYKGSVQYFLPLNLIDDKQPDLALVAEKNPIKKVYTVKTALPIGMAYMDTRTISRPVVNWLNH